MTKNNKTLHAKNSSGETEKFWVDSRDIQNFFKEVYEKKILLLLLYKISITWRAWPVVDCVALSSFYARLTKNFRHWATTQL